MNILDGMLIHTLQLKHHTRNLHRHTHPETIWNMFYNTISQGSRRSRPYIHICVNVYEETFKAYGEMTNKTTECVVEAYARSLWSYVSILCM
jgi:hypothetical protein